MQSTINLGDPDLQAKFDNLEMKLKDWWKLAGMLSFPSYHNAVKDYHIRERQQRTDKTPKK
jgi:hypothetical protein